MSLVLVCWCALRVTAALTLPPALAARGVAYFEAPRSVGTPVAELARVYEGVSLGGRIAGRFWLDTDASLDSATREQIRWHLAHRS
ncbi:MAG: hypothetical protein QOH59_290 [Gemmatimonadales bacterium]|nr:hypothetical protein [Gemmatimonadales bacterium]